MYVCVSGESAWHLDWLKLLLYTQIVLYVTHNNDNKLFSYINTGANEGKERDSSAIHWSMCVCVCE